MKQLNQNTNLMCVFFSVFYALTFLTRLPNLKWPERNMEASIFLLLHLPLSKHLSPNQPPLLFVTTVRSDCSPGGDTPALLCICSENQSPICPEHVCCVFWFVVWALECVGLMFGLAAAVRLFTPRLFSLPKQEVDLKGRLAIHISMTSNMTEAKFKTTSVKGRSVVFLQKIISFYRALNLLNFYPHLRLFLQIFDVFWLF